MSNATPPEICNLARRLIALEASCPGVEGSVDPAVRVCGEIRRPLVRLAGAAGFRSLMTRAKALAMAEAPWLESVRVSADGLLEGFDAAHSRPDAVQGEAAGFVIVAQLLGLLVIFIGEPLTLQILRDVWPDAAGTDAGSGEST